MNKLILFLPLFAFAKEYKFNYTYEKQAIKLVVDADSWNEAYEIAAVECFDFFTEKKKLPEDRAMDIIDVCVNPR